MAKISPTPATIPVPTSRAQAEQLLAAIAFKAARLQTLSATLTSKLALVRADCEPEITALDKVLTEERAAIEAWAWAADGAGTEFIEKRSEDFSHGTVGFRAGKKSLALLSRQTWDTVLVCLRTQPEWKNFIRTKQEVDKVALLKSTTALPQDAIYLPPNELSAIGVKVVQEETFYLDLKQT